MMHKKYVKEKVKELLNDVFKLCNDYDIHLDKCKYCGGLIIHEEETYCRWCDEKIYDEKKMPKKERWTLK